MVFDSLPTMAEVNAARRAKPKGAESEGKG